VGIQREAWLSHVNEAILTLWQSRGHGAASEINELMDHEGCLIKIQDEIALFPADSDAQIQERVRHRMQREVDAVVVRHPEEAAVLNPTDTHAFLNLHVSPTSVAEARRRLDASAFGQMMREVERTWDAQGIRGAERERERAEFLSTLKRHVVPAAK
jgi:hypothetical protein